MAHKYLVTLTPGKMVISWPSVRPCPAVCRKERRARRRCKTFRKRSQASSKSARRKSSPSHPRTSLKSASPHKWLRYRWCSGREALKAFEKIGSRAGRLNWEKIGANRSRGLR